MLIIGIKNHKGNRVSKFVNDVYLIFFNDLDKVMVRESNFLIVVQIY